MPAWLVAVLRVLGIRRAADVPAAPRDTIADAIAPEAPDPVPPTVAGGTLIIKAAPPRPPRKGK